MKTCSKCKTEKELIRFSKNSSTKDGLSGKCRECSRDPSRPRRICYGPEDKEKRCILCKAIKNVSEFYKDRSRKCGTHPWCHDCSKTIRKPYFDSWNQKDETREYKRKWHNKNKERLAPLAKERNKRNRILNNAKSVEKSKTDLQFKMKAALRKRLCKIVSGHTKSGSSVKDLGCTLEYFLSYIKSLFQSGMSWDNHGRGPGHWELDHIVALLNFDLMDRNQFLKACHYTNLQPLWYEDHKRKTREDLKNHKRSRK